MAGIAEDRPGQRDPLPLAAGQAVAAGADDRVVAAVQFLFDEAVGVGLLGGRDHFLAGGLRRAVADVVVHRVVEQQRLLRDQADLPPQVAQPQFAQVDAVQPHGAADRIGEPRHQVGQRGLAAAVGADDAQRLAEGDRQVDVVQHRLVRRVVEVDVVEDQPAVRPRRPAAGGPDRRSPAGGPASERCGRRRPRRPGCR